MKVVQCAFSCRFIEFCLIHQNFDNEGHKLTIDGSYTKNKDNEDSTIDGVNLTFPDKATFGTTNSEIQEQFQFQTDYVLLQVKEVNLRLDIRKFQ
jgi:hypothetical protein